MRIALITTGGVDRSGRERVIPGILWLMERLARHHRLTVIALYQYDKPCDYELLGAKVYNLGAAPGLPLAWVPYHLRQLRAIEAAEGGFDVIHAFWGGKTGWLATLYAKWRGIPSVVTLFGGELVNLPVVNYGAQRTFKGRLLVRQVLNWATTLTVQSRAMQDLVAAHGYHAEHLPVGVDTNYFAPPATRPKRNGARLLQVASLNKIKDQPTLLRAMAQVVLQAPETRLDIIGVDTLDGSIQRLASELRLEQHVHFHGFLIQEEVRPFYHDADIFVLTSRHEAGPIAVLEAAACGVPTAGTRVGHVADWDGREGVAVPVANPDALARALLELLRDEPRRATLGNAARRWAEHHNADYTAKRFETLFQQLASQLRTAPGFQAVDGVNRRFP